MNAARRARASVGARKHGWVGWLAGGLALALVVTFAVVSNGFDSREVPREEPSVWVERAAGQFARVNTETAEIDTVRIAESPSGLVQSGDLGVLLTQGFGRAWVIDPASPQDVFSENAEQVEQPEQAVEAGDETEKALTADEVADAQAVDGADATEESSAQGGSAMRTPSGTRQVIAAGDSVLFFTERGEAYVSGATSARGSAGASLGTPTRIDPFAELQTAVEGEEPPQYLASAAAIDDTGRVALYSNEEGGVRWYDIDTAEFRGGLSEVPSGVPATDVQLAIVGGQWVLFDAEGSRLWRQGSSEAIEIETVGRVVLQASSSVDAGVLLADEAGLWSIVDGVAERIVSADGVPAQPRYLAEQPVAAWIGASSALMWAEGVEISLQLDDSVEDLSNADPEIRSNGSRAVLIDRRTGMMWTVPDGRLIPVEQWSLVDPPKQESGTVVTQDVAEQEPPVAVADSFGVRSGEAVLLPVLLNDYDPNRRDVLTVVAEGLGEGLAPEFGSVSLMSDGQGVVLQPGAGAAGSASFSYRITDGVNLSAPATVSLTVVGDETNTAPEWCLVDGCQRSWPSPQLAPGGTLILPILEGWVDPEGDPMMLVSASALNAEDPIRALVTADGKLAVRHTDPNAPAGDIAVRVTVTDSRGAETDRELRVRVRQGAEMDFAPSATTVRVGEATIVRPLERVSGGSGSFQLVDAVVQQGALVATVNQGGGSVELLASAAGSTLLAVTVRDTGTGQETTGVMRVTAVENRAAFGVPPLRAFVRPLADTTVDVLAAVAGANSRALTVQSATVNDGQLRADVIEHSRVRVSGATVDGQPGRIGAVDVQLAEGADSAVARLTVFQVADAAAGAIAVTDTATVRAGSVVDIAVLENDVAPPGERLVLHPEIGAPGADGELAFASGSSVRYLAPQQPGEYTLSYTTYGASSPESSDVGQVRVTVLPAGSNRDPQPATVTVRVAPGEQVRATVPLSGVDPDGDRVRLVSVEAPENSQLSANIVSRSNAVQVAASTSAERGTHLIDYRVRDPQGGEATGRLRIIVTDPDAGGRAPIVYSDYVRIARGASDPVVVRPLENDLDPSGGTLEIVSVEPNVPGGVSSELYQQLAERLDLEGLDDGVVRIIGGELGTVSYRYTVRSNVTKSTADGLIVVQVSERVGLQAPAVTDTVLSVRDRADFERAGVDVVTDRVRWASGDASTLQLSLWGSVEDRYDVSGSTIRGSYRAEGDTVPFRLAGVDATGAEVQTFGFLIVPPLDELRLSLKPGVAAVTVNESESVDFDVAQMLDLGGTDRIELDQGVFSVQRQQARCEVVSGTTVRYTAGREAPWGDNCTVRVRLVEQTTYTVLPIPVNIVPDAPVVLLNPLTRTIAPGESEAINLIDMLQWQGGREGEVNRLSWQTSGGTSAFEVTASGPSVQVVARADAVPGTQETLTVSAAGSGESQALLTLRVGEAARDTPRGGTVSLQCTVGSSCGAPLVGIAGEHDPFAGKSGGGLQLVSVDGGSCTYGALSAVGDALRVTWADARGPGGQCVASFTVRDAQNRIGTGTIELDAQGVPRAPASISLVAFDSQSVTLEVNLGEAAGAHPATTGIVVNRDGDGAVGNCSPSGASYRCVVDGLTIGQQHTFTARAVNAVGESEATANGALAWAFDRPELSGDQLSLEQLSAESTQTGTARISVAAGDENIARVQIAAGGVTGVIEGSSGSVTLTGLSVGQLRYTATPVSRFAPPMGNGSSDGLTVERDDATVIGLPSLTDFRWESSDGSRDALVSFTVEGNHDLEEKIAWGANGGASCSPSEQGSSAEATLSASAPYTSYQFTICGKNSFGEVSQTQTVWVGGHPPALTLGSYTVDSTPEPQGSGFVYGLQGQPSVTGQVPGASIDFTPGGSSLQLDGSTVPTVTAVQCVGPENEYCSSQSNAAGWVNAPTIVSIIPNGVCYDELDPPADLRALFNISAAAYENVDITVLAPGADGRITLNASWSGDFAGLADAQIQVCFTAAPPPPEPEPEEPPGTEPEEP